LSIPLNAGTADLTVSVIVEVSKPDTNGGLTGVVELQRR
jgi:hypothetical protein